MHPVAFLCQTNHPCYKGSQGFQQLVWVHVGTVQCMPVISKVSLYTVTRAGQVS